MHAAAVAAMAAAAIANRSFLDIAVSLIGANHLAFSRLLTGPLRAGRPILKLGAQSRRGRKADERNISSVS